MRALGLDVGQKTIGVAMTDALNIAAHPVEVIARNGIAEDLARLKTLIGENEVAFVVVGLPFEMSGKIGLRARRVQVFISALRAAISDRIEIHEWDERFSTVAVERVLIDADLSRKRRKQVIDKQAAAYILQGWLDSRPSSADSANSGAGVEPMDESE